MRGYKIFGADYTCREYKYSLTDWNLYDGALVPCKSGFHFCPRALDCLFYYNLSPVYTYAQVECGGDYLVKDDKVVCRELKILRTLTFDEFKELLSGDIDTPTEKCTYVKGKLHGSYKQFNNGVLILDAMYYDGELHGEYKEWYIKSQTSKKIDTHYNKGKIHGYYNKWYIDGNIQSVSKYIDGEKHGVCREFFPNGNIQREAIYSHGRLDGLYREWTQSGTLVWETTFVDDIIHGSYKKWNNSGNLILNTRYEHGRDLKTKE